MREHEESKLLFAVIHLSGIIADRLNQKAENKGPTRKAGQTQHKTTQTGGEIRVVMQHSEWK